MITVFQAVFRPEGDERYDPVRPVSGEPRVRYVRFSNRLPAGPHLGWEIRPPAFQHPDPRRQARQHKCLAHALFPDSEFTLWLDGSLTPLVSPEQMISLLGANDIAAFDRRKRRCAYAEAAEMARKRRDDPRLIHRQARRYHREGYPPDHGLCATTAVLRRTCPQIEGFNELWWSEIARGCNRDQVSVNYCLWRLGLKWSALPGRWNRSPWFDWRPHYQT